MLLGNFPLASRSFEEALRLKPGDGRTHACLAYCYARGRYHRPALSEGKAAVKAGQMLDLQEMRELVLQLERTPRPSTCPHGRPTMIHLSHSQLEREFGRR